MHNKKINKGIRVENLQKIEINFFSNHSTQSVYEFIF